MQQSNDIIITLQKQLQKLSQQNKNLKKQLADAKLKPKHCHNDHILTFKVMPWESKIICNKCNKKINDFSYMSWNCSKCGYNQCYKCGGFALNYCSNSHELKQNLYNKQLPYLCNICGANLKNLMGYRCSECEYDICLKCNGKEQNQKQ